MVQFSCHLCTSIDLEFRFYKDCCGMRAWESCEPSQSVKQALLGCVNDCAGAFLSTKTIQANFYNPLII